MLHIILYSFDEDKHDEYKIDADIIHIPENNKFWKINKVSIPIKTLIESPAINI